MMFFSTFFFNSQCLNICLHILSMGRFELTAAEPCINKQAHCAVVYFINKDVHDYTMRSYDKP